mmetsp:Transcript_34036/g.78470  ORF Transcript_34036/g.78470 Transcript_34036/m.78470 type:complete len:95 (-) Transcript_34036:1468-1752(-)
MSFAQRAADFAHKGVVLGLAGLFGFQAYQIAKNVSLGAQPQTKHPQEDYIQTLRDKADEDYKKHYKIDHRDWYDKDDDSYLKNAPRPNRPPAKA